MKKVVFEGYIMGPDGKPMPKIESHPDGTYKPEYETIANAFVSMIYSRGGGKDIDVRKEMAWANSVRDNGYLLLDDVDLKRLITIVEENPQFTSVAKYPILMALDNAKEATL
jgi:hypothetical protein